MENSCYFTSSRGILKSCHFHSLKPKSGSKDNKKYLFFMLKNMFNGMSIYVCSNLLSFFVDFILPKMNKNFVLVSGDSTLCVPKEALSVKQTNFLIRSPYLIKWFVQNTQIQGRDKIIQLPLGLDYHTILNNPSSKWVSPGEKNLPKDQEKILFDVKEKGIPFYERIPKIYVNFTKNNDRFGDRKKALASVQKSLLVVNNSFTSRTQNWLSSIKYTFILSPFGIGMDCHRTWEALCLGCIPIVKAPNFSKLFEGLPVLIVKDWKDINQELLDKTIEEFKNKNFDYEKLTLAYWTTKINEFTPRQKT